MTNYLPRRGKEPHIKAKLKGNSYQNNWKELAAACCAQIYTGEKAELPATGHR